MMIQAFMEETVTKTLCIMSFDCSITIPHGMSIAHTMSLNQNIKKIIKELVAKKIIILEWFNSARKYIGIILGPKIFQPDLT